MKALPMTRVGSFCATFMAEGGRRPILPANADLLQMLARKIDVG